MHKHMLLLLVIAGLLPCAAPGGEGKESPSADRLQGTWKLVSYRYKDMQDFSDAPDYCVSLWTITGNRFTWITYYTRTKMVCSAAGGTHAVEGDSCTERVEYGDKESANEYIGKDLIYASKLDGDKWHRSGTLPNGLKVEEIWERLK